MAAWPRCLRAVATLLLLASTAAPDVAPSDPWQAAVVYHVNVRLFRDADGDGVGDLAGVTENLGFLAKLGVDVIWLSPIFSSASEYYVGHKISNFTDIDPAFGDMHSFQKLVEKATSLGVKVLLEVVPNHTSDSHEWFECSVGRQEPYTDYYVWDDGAGKDDDDDREPPNNWLSVTGGSAWTWNEERRQYFLHQFGDAQPDLNFRNKDVRREMEEILVFWLQRGVSGFVLSGISHLYEHKDLQDEPLRSTDKDWQYSHLVHNNTLDQPETYLQVHRWRKLLDEFGSSENLTRFLVVESHSSLQSVLSYYGSEDTSITDMPLNFLSLSSLHLNSNAKEMETAIKDWLLNMPQGRTANWMVGSSTLNDMVTHFDAHKVDALNVMLQMLPGVSVVYNGDSTAETAWDETAEFSSQAAGDEAYSSLNWDLSQPFNSAAAATGPGRNGTGMLEPDSSPAEGKKINQELEDVHSRLLKKVALKSSTPTLLFGDIQVSAVTTDVLLLVRTLGGWDTFAAFINSGEGITTMDMFNLLHNVTLVIVHTCSTNSGLKEEQKLSSSKVNLPPHASVMLRLSYEPLDSMATSAEELDLQTELFPQDLDNSTTINDNVTEMLSQLHDNSTDITTDAIYSTSQLLTEVETSTAAPEYSTEISAEISDVSTDVSLEIPYNSTEASEVGNESTEMYTQTPGIENSTEISTAANVNNPELYSGDFADNVTTSVSPCNTCTKAHQQTESTTSSKVGERHKPHLFTLLVILISPGLL